MKQAKDNSSLGCSTDGAGNLVPIAVSTGGTKQPGMTAPDGSRYMKLTDGNGN